MSATLFAYSLSRRSSPPSPLSLHSARSFPHPSATPPHLPPPHSCASSSPPPSAAPRLLFLPALGPTPQAPARALPPPISSPHLPSLALSPLLTPSPCLPASFSSLLQSLGSVASSSFIHPPLTFDMYFTRGAFNSTLLTSSSYLSATSSIIFVWNACLVPSLLHTTPSPLN